jgi:uncharacterized protein (UPF0332 family)
MLSVGLNGPAARSAYMAAFHGAQAVIQERTSRVVKTHGGVQAEFACLTRGDPTLTQDLRAFLGRAYKLKTASDYAVGPSATITAADAEMALGIARRFVDWVAAP